MDQSNRYAALDLKEPQPPRLEPVMQRPGQPLHGAIQRQGTRYEGNAHLDPIA